MILKRMGVMNVTPNSFSDGGELTPATFESKLRSFGPIDALDLGAESTAPMNDPITADEEWQRLSGILPFLKNLQCLLSLDTYHPETIFRFAENWKGPLIWNDVSGKFDAHVKDFLAMNDNFHYVLCHNLAPSRELTNRHMNYLSLKQGREFLQELAEFFRPHLHPRVILDPCLGFSKTYEQNWFILDHFRELQDLLPENRWLLGFSRKSFLRKKFDLTMAQRDELDLRHIEVLRKIWPSLHGEVWVRTHRPEKLVGLPLVAAPTK